MRGYEKIENECEPTSPLGETYGSPYAYCWHLSMPGFETLPVTSACRSSMQACPGNRRKTELVTPLWAISWLGVDEVKLTVN